MFCSVPLYFGFALFGFEEKPGKATPSKAVQRGLALKVIKLTNMFSLLFRHAEKFAENLQKVENP